MFASNEINSIFNGYLQYNRLRPHGRTIEAIPVRNADELSVRPLFHDTYTPALFLPPEKEGVVTLLIPETAMPRSHPTRR